MLWCGDGWPEAIPPADGAIAAVGALREIKVRLKAHRATMAAARVGLQHVSFCAVQLLVRPRERLFDADIVE